jgi:hypothetical protein
MKAIYSLASQVMSGAFVACLALAFVGYAYGDPGGGGGGECQPGECPVCPECAYVEVNGCSLCSNSGAAGLLKQCWQGTFGTPPECAGQHPGQCDEGCLCMNEGLGNFCG